MIDPLAYCRRNDQHERDNQVAAPGTNCQHAGHHHQGQEHRFNQIAARQVFDKWCEYKQEAQRHQKLGSGVTRDAEPMRGFMLRFHLVSTVSFASAHLHCGPCCSRSSETYSLILLFHGAFSSCPMSANGGCLLLLNSVHLFSGAKMVFQSSFLLITLQPFVFASALI